MKNRLDFIKTTVVGGSRLGNRGGLSFKIQGTTANPSFVPDVESMAGNAAKGALEKSVSEKTDRRYLRA